MTTARIQAVERATGKAWDDWLQFMADIGAEQLGHHEIATKVLETLDGVIDNPAWWAQSATVAYEQFIGRRIPGQRPDGTFQTSVSKATALPMRELMDTWSAFAAADSDVCDRVAGEVRVSGTDRRITWRTTAHDGSKIQVTSEPKKDGAASLVIVQMGMETVEGTEETKAFWSSVLQRFLDSL